MQKYHTFSRLRVMNPAVIGEFIPLKMIIRSPQEEAHYAAIRASGHAAGRHLQQALREAQISGQ